MNWLTDTTQVLVSAANAVAPKLRRFRTVYSAISGVAVGAGLLPAPHTDPYERLRELAATHGNLSQRLDRVRQPLGQAKQEGFNAVAAQGLMLSPRSRRGTSN